MDHYTEDYTTVTVPFTTHASDGSPVAPSSGFEAADVRIYKNGGATQKTTTNGVTMDSPFDSITGCHMVTIDTSNDTGDSGFWTAGSIYDVYLNPDETVDGVAVGKWIGKFYLGALPADVIRINSLSGGVARFERALRAITTGTVGSASTVTSVVTSSLDPSATITDQFKGLILAFDKDTTTAALRGQKTDITASSTGGVLTVTSLTTAPVSGDLFTIE